MRDIMGMTPLEHCETLITTMKVSYTNVGSIYCPILQKEIVFNAKGFHHLQYKPDGTARTVAEKIHKLMLVPLAPVVIKNAIGIFEEREVDLPDGRGKGARRLKGKQYALIATVGKKKPIEVRVIILDIEGTPNPIFWSIMKH